MLSIQALKGLVNKKGLSTTDKFLLCLGFEADKPKQGPEIKKIGKSAGLTEADRWNISDIVKRSDGKAIRTLDGWELSPDGQKYVASIAGPAILSPAPKMAAQLRNSLTTITDPDVVSFVEEAIRCLELKLLRAAVVLAWVGAVAILQQHIISKKLTEFNSESVRRFPKWWTAARTTDDLGRMKETDFLEVLLSIKVIGKNVKKKLAECLDLRNGCGHPTSLKLGEYMVAAHVEALILNVYSKF